MNSVVVLPWAACCASASLCAQTFNFRLPLFLRERDHPMKLLRCTRLQILLCFSYFCASHASGILTLEILLLLPHSFTSLPITFTNPPVREFVSIGFVSYWPVFYPFILLSGDRTNV
ncbi:hypothetical protein BGW80DRAFT_868101 [Lactifluus volemus]|nr:hypothetical protein BGW80DRAFT_868101 [Lactifluus volemus]